MREKSLALKIIFPAALFVTAVAFGQTPQINKPNTKTQVDPLPGSFVPHNPNPTGYGTGVNVNYVRVKEAMGKYDNEATFEQMGSGVTGYNNVKESTQYLDGLGRPLQIVNRQATAGPAPKDMVTPLTYDEFGRQKYNFLQYSANSVDGKFKLNPFTDQFTFMQSQFPGEQVFYGITYYENSSLDRPEKNFAAGNSWGGNR